MRTAGAIAALLCCACAQTPQQDALNELREDLANLQVHVLRSNSSLTALESSNTASRAGIDEQIRALHDSVTVLTEQFDELGARCATPATATPQCEQAPDPVVMVDADKMLLGELERVWVDPPGLSMLARVDTGASSSSLHAENVTTFERDGDDWVRFEIGNGKTKATIERPVTKTVRVFQQADKSGSRRPVVELRVALGDVRETFPFTLADRSHLDQDMILGRNFLTDIATVDVSRQFVQPAYSPAEE